MPSNQYAFISSDALHEIKPSGPVLPVVVGTIARTLRKPAPPFTHEWVCFLRGADNESLAKYIKRVDFFLDKSYSDHCRTVTEEPFETTDRAWGEFPIRVRVHLREELFKKGSKRCTVELLQSALVLDHPELLMCDIPGGGGNGPEYIGVASSAKYGPADPIVAERYDEVWLYNATEQVAADLAKRSGGKRKQCLLNGPAGWSSIARDLEEYRPAWQLDKNFHAARMEDMRAQLLGAQSALHHELEQALWEQGAALQRVWQAKHAQKADAKTKKDASSKRKGSEKEKKKDPKRSKKA